MALIGTGSSCIGPGFQGKLHLILDTKPSLLPSHRGTCQVNMVGRQLNGEPEILEKIVTEELDLGGVRIGI